MEKTISDMMNEDHCVIKRLLARFVEAQSLDMSEIAKGAHSFALAKSKPAISECWKSDFQQTRNLLCKFLSSCSRTRPGLSARRFLTLFKF